MATGPLQLMRKTVEDRLLPAFAENGFEPDPRNALSPVWNTTLGISAIDIGPKFIT